MENATKALLIAAAVLVAILIISLGLVVYNMAAEAVNNSANLSEYEIQAFNDKFKKYEGTNVSGTTVNAMINTVFNHNLAQEDAARKITVKDAAGTTSPKTYVDAGNVTKSPSKVDTGKRYQVTATYNSNSKLITELIITHK